ncbi:MAG: chemotaxis protein MotB [Elusimicrobia bacterium]|nr:MAG: chemotaxis protein MotB [Elusimicrobiota bacterium]
MAVYRFRKEELEGHLNKNALWAIVYGDMMSYLMILFLIMLSNQLAKSVDNIDPVERTLIEVQRVFGGKPDPRLVEKAQQKDRELIIGTAFQQGVESGKFGVAASVIVSEKRILLSLGEGVLFASGKAELKDSAVPVFDSVAKDMQNLANEIRVEGHTDNVPIRGGGYKSNWELSMARAYAVIKQLESAGVDPKRISGVGYGEYRPIGDNKTAEGRAKNRRIEISLLRGE